MRFLEHGLSVDDWAPIERFYADLVTLARIEQFAVVAVIMPVSDIADRVDHPYAREARTRLERLGIRYVDGFALGLDDMRTFCPRALMRI